MFIQSVKAQAGMLDGHKRLFQFNSFNAFLHKKGLWVETCMMPMQEKNLK